MQGFTPRPVNQAGAQGKATAARRRWLFPCQLLRPEPPLD